MDDLQGNSETLAKTRSDDIVVETNIVKTNVAETSFEADLFAAGFKWKFKQAKGLDFGIDFEQYRAALNLLLFQESNADTIKL